MVTGAGDVGKPRPPRPIRANDSWASGWSAIYQLGILAGDSDCCCDQVAAVPPPNPPTLSIIPNGVNLDISFPTQSGYLYQLQTNNAINSLWGNYGEPIPGGSPALISVPNDGGILYFRVLAY